MFLDMTGGVYDECLTMMTGPSSWNIQELI